MSRWSVHRWHDQGGVNDSASIAVEIADFFLAGLKGIDKAKAKAAKQPQKSLGAQNGVVKARYKTSRSSNSLIRTTDWYRFRP